jgi:hypothetical protein
LPTDTPSPTETPLPTATSEPTPGVCHGDCDGDGTVAINELIRMVSIALGDTPLSECPAADADADGLVAINELIAAVNGALQACGAA